MKWPPVFDPGIVADAGNVARCASAGAREADVAGRAGDEGPGRAGGVILESIDPAGTPGAACVPLMTPDPIPPFR
jgi:hypothetical protein